MVDQLQIFDTSEQLTTEEPPPSKSFYEASIDWAKEKKLKRKPKHVLTGNTVSEQHVELGRRAFSHKVLQEVRSLAKEYLPRKMKQVGRDADPDLAGMNPSALSSLGTVYSAFHHVNYDIVTECKTLSLPQIADHFTTIARGIPFNHNKPKPEARAGLYEDREDLRARMAFRQLSNSGQGATRALLQNWARILTIADDYPEWWAQFYKPPVRRQRVKQGRLELAGSGAF